MYKSNKKKEFCLICYKSLTNISFSSLFSKENCICRNCYNSFKRIEKQIIYCGVETLFIYEYDKFFKSLLYQYKGCYDIALNKVFLNGYEKMINKKYKGYLIIYPPSFYKDDMKREFVHIKEIAKNLKLKIVDAFIKKSNYKQSSNRYSNRDLIKNEIMLKQNVINKDSKYLIIDDVFTSGKTLKTIIELLKKIGVKKDNIKALILSKTADFVEL